MAYQFSNVDTTEPISDSDGEIKGNVHLYGVISGCDVTLDAANMTVDIAAGTILHNGSVVTVAEQLNVQTLVSDPSNPRFTWVGLDSAGAGQIVSGDASADPVVPELGDHVALSLILIPKDETIAANCTDIEKRIPTHQRDTTIVKAADETVNNSSTLQDDDDFLFTVTENNKYLVEMWLLINSGVTPDFKWGWSLPASTTGFAIYQMSANQLNTTTIMSGSSIDGQAAERMFYLSFIFEVAATAGTAQFQWAQNTADASNTIVGAGSVMRYQKVA